MIDIENRLRAWAACVSVALATFGPGPARAAVKLPPVISSHMVLQRDISVPIWGTAAPGEQVTVTFRDQRKETTTDPRGTWKVALDPLKAGGPDTLTVNGLTLEDVLVGDVWVGSGQSNMAWTAGMKELKNDTVLASDAAAAHPRLRLCDATQRRAWEVSDVAANSRFSALMFSFGLRLQRELDVPVGVIVGAVGATPSSLWLSQAAFDSDPACLEAVARAMPAYEAAAEKAKAEGKPLPLKPGEFSAPWSGWGRPFGRYYAGMIKPVMPYAIRGVLWDQGEHLTAVEGVDQRTMMAALIKGWRAEWGQGDFPFLYVQKPSGGGCAWDADDPVTRLSAKFAALPPAPPKTAGQYLEVHLRIMEHPKTAMVICSDLSGGGHPEIKSGYGARAARVALGMAYGRPVEIYGPVTSRT